MTLFTIIALLLIGLAAGVLSGAFGIGGGVVLVPALVFFLAFSQQKAQGTTLAMLMIPVVALGVYNYYQDGYVSFKAAFLMGAGFVLGGYLGSKLVLMLPDTLTLGEWVVRKPLKKLFALLMFALAVKMMLDK